LNSSSLKLLLGLMHLTYLGLDSPSVATNSSSCAEKLTQIVCFPILLALPATDPLLTTDGLPFGGALPPLAGAGLSYLKR
jgi:hypothetical protein